MGLFRTVRAAVNPPKVAPKEIGYQRHEWGTEWLPAVDLDLAYPKSVGVFSRMRRDAQVGGMLDAVTLPIQSTGWFLDPAGATPEVVRLVAEDLGLPVRGLDDGPAPLRTRDRFSFTEHLRLALLELAFGHSFFEQVYRIEEGRARLHKLAWRPPETIAKIKVATDGGLEWIEQYPGKTGDRPRITVDRLVVYVNRREGGDWVGQSLLRRARSYYLLKEELLRILALTDQRNGMGMPIYEAMPPLEGEDPDQARAAITTELAEAANLVKAARAGDEAGIALPPGSKFTLQGVQGRLPDILAHVRYCDEQIAASVLAHFLNLGQQTGTGSYALGETFAAFFIQSLQTVATQIAGVIQSHVIEDLVDLNFGARARAPQIRFDEIGSKHPATAEALSALAQAGILLPEPNLEGFVRSLYNIPAKAPYQRASGSE
jgi:hypothetical protein